MICFAQQGHRKKERNPAAQARAAWRRAGIIPLFEDIGELDWFTACCRLTNRSTAQLGRVSPKGVDESFSI